MWWYPRFATFDGCEPGYHRTQEKYGSTATLFGDAPIQTIHSIRTVLRSSTLHHILLLPVAVHLDGLPRSRVVRPQEPRREDIVSVRQHLGTSESEGVVPQIDVQFLGGHHGALVNGPSLASAMTLRDADATDVAIVVENQRLLIQIVHIVLLGKPRPRVFSSNN